MRRSAPVQSPFALDLGNVCGADEFYDLLGQHIELPAYFGRNLDALYDVLTEQPETIEDTAQDILDARDKFPDCSLADLYDETTMPPELRKAHQANDAAVMKLYGYKPDMPEPAIVADLMKRYQTLTDPAEK